MADLADELCAYLRMRPKGPRPLLWIGAGASATAGYPTLAELERKLRIHLGPTPAQRWELIDEYVATYSKADLVNVLETEVGAPRPFQPLHRALARLAGAGWFASVFTTNFDELIERALEAEGVRYVPQVLEANLVLGGRSDLSLLKLHGSRTDWKDAVLTSASHRAYQAAHPLLQAQLTGLLRQHPVVFVGCSMTDPRLLEWLRGLGADARDGLYGGRAILTSAAWQRIPDVDRALLKSARIKPIEVTDHDQVTALLGAAARDLPPLDAEAVVFTITPEATTWTVVGPTVESPPHLVASPLADRALAAALHDLSVLARRPVIRGHPEESSGRAAARTLATQVGERLTAVLLSTPRGQPCSTA